MDMKILVGRWPGRVPVNGKRDEWDGNTGGQRGVAALLGA
jgi:hypothetical protein